MQSTDPLMEKLWLEGVNQLRRETNRLSSTRALSKLADCCLERCRNTREPITDCGWEAWALVCVFYRLSEITTDDSARLLVDLYYDDRLQFDGEYSECAGEALFACRQYALPHIRLKLSSAPEWKRAYYEDEVAWLESDEKRW